MLLLLLAFIGGALTILSPCILPVIPFVFSRAGLPFRSSGLPMLAGMALTFAGVAALASYGGGWVVQANQYGRDAAFGAARGVRPSRCSFRTSPNFFLAPSCGLGIV